MRIIIFFAFLCGVKSTVFANTYELQRQVECLCSAQVSCDLNRPQSWIFTHESSQGKNENYLIHTSLGKPQIYRLKSPRLAEGQTLENAMAWIEVGEGKQTQHLALTFDLSGRIRHLQTLKQSPIKFRKDLENWREAKHLESLLIQNGIPLQRQGLQPGTWLLRQSDRVGLLPARGLTENDKNLTNVIQRYDDESREPFLQRARAFQKEQRNLFSSCPLEGSLCKGGALDPIPLQEDMNPELMRQWRPVFERYLDIYLSQSKKSRLDVCPEPGSEQISRVREYAPSLIEPASATRP